MPVISFTRDHDGAYPFLSEEVLALMVFPTDAAARDAARCTLILSRLCETADVITADAAMVRAAVAGPGLGAVRKAMKERTIRGFVAGAILLGLRAMRARCETPSVSECVRQLETELAAYESFGGEKKGYGDRSMRSAWSEFRSVAHYWAAAQMLFARLTGGGTSADWQQVIVGGAEWARLMHNDTSRVIAGAAAILEQSRQIMLDDGKGKVPLFDDDEPWIPPPDYPLPSQLGQV